MSRSEAILAVAASALMLVVVLVSVLRYRGKGKVNMRLPFGAAVDLEGDNATPPRGGRIIGEDLQAGRDLKAIGKTGGDVEVRRAKAGGDLTLGTEQPRSDRDPKG